MSGVFWLITVEIMRLRLLKDKDAKYMLEWMHDSSVVKFLRADFGSKTIEDCVRFISNSRNDENIHLAIVDEQDCYMGTVSLKHIIDDSAEFAIAIRKGAMGKGYSKWAMNEIINLAFTKYHIKNVYWCVDVQNGRALRFYEKNGFKRVDSDIVNISEAYTQEMIDKYIWFQVSIKETGGINEME